MLITNRWSSKVNNVTCSNAISFHVFDSVWDNIMVIEFDVEGWV